MIEGARELAEMEASGSLAVAIRWDAPTAPPAGTVEAVARVCEAHPGPAAALLFTGPMAMANRRGCDRAGCVSGQKRKRCGRSATSSARRPFH